MTESSNAVSGETQGPWFKDGLQFTCTQCGDCCTGAAGVVWVTDDELLEIAEYLDKPIGEIRLFHTRIVRGRVSLTEFANGDCTFFDPKARNCTVYRPDRCSVEPGRSGIRIWKVRHRGRKSVTPAPGPGRGRFSAWNRSKSEQNGSTCEEFLGRWTCLAAPPDHNWHNSADAGKN